MASAALILVGGPHDRAEAAVLPSDVAAPVQIVWAGWLYEWHGQTVTEQGMTIALLYRFTGRRLTPDEIPPLIAETVEVWADGADMIARAFDIPPELIWPGL